MADGLSVANDVSAVARRDAFTPLAAGDFEEFRQAACGDLRVELDRLGRFDPSPLLETWTYRRNGLGPIRGMGGFNPEEPWRWRLWSFPGDLNFSDWKAVMRFTRKRLERRMADSRCLRIEATARQGHHGAAELLVHLGFRLEGLMACYGPRGEAHWLFAIACPPALHPESGEAVIG